MLADLTVIFDGTKHLIPVPSGSTLLEAAEASGLDLPSLCRQGTCGACAVMLIAGHVTMNDCPALSKRDRDSGLILACQAMPDSPQLTISYD